jgi:hypothetical protein
MSFGAKDLVGNSVKMLMLMVGSEFEIREIRRMASNRELLERGVVVLGFLHLGSREQPSRRCVAIVELKVGAELYPSIKRRPDIALCH